MNKNITELTKEEAEEILEFVYPNQTPLGNPKNYDYWVQECNFTPTGFLTFGGNPDIGIKYRGGLNNDGFLLPFNHSKVVYWLYIHGYDIEDFLKENLEMSNEMYKFTDFSMEIENTLNLDFSKKIKNRLKRLLNKFYYGIEQ